MIPFNAKQSCPVKRLRLPKTGKLLRFSSIGGNERPGTREWNGSGLVDMGSVGLATVPFE